MKKLINSKLIMYIYFAVLTTIINIVVYLFVYNIIIKSILISNILAYGISLTMSFITNKKIVYKSTSKNILKEATCFMLVKFASFVIDTIILYVCVKYFHLGNLLSKIISNSSTTIPNYLLNKDFVFKKN